MLQTRTCARARRALHEPPYRTSVRAARIHPSPALATVGWAAGAVRLAAAATLATRAHLASVCSILHNGPPARARVRPSLLDLCHGTGRSSHAAAPAIMLGAYLSTHRARCVACHKPVKQQPSLLRLECFKRAPVLAHGVLYTSLPAARACGRLESTLPPPYRLLAGRWAPSALRRRRHLQHEHTSLRCARSFTTGRPQGRVCGPLYSTCATARVVLVMQPPRRSCSGRISALTARDAWRATNQ